MIHRLRDYQKAAHDAVIKEWEEVSSTLVTIPTGGGKTILFASLIHSLQPQRAMVIAHREELIWQARDKIQRFANLDCEIEMADNYVNGSLFHNTPVVVSTVQTQNSRFGDRKRMSRFKPEDFGLLILDECHHSTAQSYKDLINYYRQNAKLKVLGVTATPDRADEEALGQIFETVAFDYEILDAINDGWLVPIEQQFVSTTIDWSAVRTTAGDLNGADLAHVMETESNIQQVAGATVEIIGDRRAIVFTASVKQAEVISSIFNRHRAGMSEWVCGKTPKDDRRYILGRFQDGETQVVANCGVLTEGFDDAGVECIIMARPTKSRSLYAQMAGRSTRPLPGMVDGLPTPEERKAAIAASAKKSCLIVDFVGNSGKHKLMSSADILGGKVSDEAVERALKMAKKRGGPVRMDEAMDEAQDEIQKEREEAKRQDDARKAKLVAKVSYKSKNVSPFDAFDIQPTRQRGWDDGRTLSEKQRMLLLRQGVNPDTMPYSQGKQILNEMFRRWENKLATLKQCATLKRYGYPTKDVTMEQASKLITNIASNGWKRPATEPETTTPF